MQSPDSEVDDIDPFQPFRSKFVHTEKQLEDIRKRVTKTNFNSMLDVNKS